MLAALGGLQQGIPFYGGANTAMPWLSVLDWVAAFFGISFNFAAFTSNPFVYDSLKLIMLGSIIETGRRLFRWILSLMTFRYSVTGEFRSGDPTYEWLISYLTKEKIWRTPYDFVIESKSTRRKLRVEGGTQDAGEHVDFVPSYSISQFFRWNGYVMEITQPKTHNHVPAVPPPMYGQDDFIDDAQWGVNRRFRNMGVLTLKIYTRHQKALYDFVEFCRLRHGESSKRLVTIHSQGQLNHIGGSVGWRWNGAQVKNRRPIDTLLLDGNTIESLLGDAQEFLEVEEWYLKAGIPHRRGYLLHGPPGTGKTSTVYTVAGELGLDIYNLSLSSFGLDDNQLSLAVASLPHRCILLIEDIDCAFPTRTDEDEQPVQSAPPHPGAWPPPAMPGMWQQPRVSQVTFSGLLNVLDGIGSEEGKIFFATTNHIDRLDPALLRPGRIDRKIEYKYASARQAHGLYCRFFPAERFCDRTNGPKIGGKDILQYVDNIEELADNFASKVPDHEFSVAELQGFLLDYKMRPLDAANGIEGWVEQEREMRLQKALREKKRKEKIAAARAEEQINMNRAFVAGLGNAFASGGMQPQMHMGNGMIQSIPFGQMSSVPSPPPPFTPKELEDSEPPKLVEANESPTSSAGDSIGSLKSIDAVKVNSGLETSPIVV